jgi:TfoX/Sxy family transcriptional regulator of competence genes
VAYDQQLAARVRTALAERARVTEKKMFGGLSFMLEDQLCCGVLRDQLVVRVGPEQYGQAVAQPHVRPMDFTGRPSTGMVYVAREGLVDDLALRAWVQRAADYVAAHPRPAKRRARARQA